MANRDSIRTKAGRQEAARAWVEDNTFAIHHYTEAELMDLADRTQAEAEESRG